MSKTTAPLSRAVPQARNAPLARRVRINQGASGHAMTGGGPHVPAAESDGVFTSEFSMEFA
jgi:hypothetical protein